jgi:hypothetical protein
MSLRLESINDTTGKREDSHIYKDYDIITRFLLKIFEI